MSYTIPEYVDTPEQAILAVASAVKGEAVTGGDGTVNRALDILADTLAESDVQVPQTDAGAILALAQYVSGMVKPEGTIAITENGEGIDVAQYATADVSVSGGGGVTLGPQTPVAYLASATMPTTSTSASDLWEFYDAQILTVGDVTIADASGDSNTISSTGGFAAGVTVTTLWMPAYGTAEQDAAHAYLYTLDEDNAITSVTEVPDVLTMETDESSQKRYTFTVPTVPDGQHFGTCYVGNYD